MRFLVRLFFRALRRVLGPFMLLWEYLSRPRGLVRTPAEQQQVDTACRALTLYQFSTCPFCIKVRQEMRRLSLDIRRLDAQQQGPGREALLKGGGEVKVPCLRIDDDPAGVRWLYESGQIIAYLRERFDVPCRP